LGPDADARPHGEGLLTGWSARDAERFLASLEPVGWRFGLDRIRRLTTALGMPQHRFASIHVVGTNGKSSVAVMTAAILDAHGYRTGAYLSPHLERWSERIRVLGEEIRPERFAAAVERVARSVPAVNRTLEEGDAVTQFEALTAAAFVAFAQAGLEVAVIEAGLGGRLDATNVIPSRASVLTSVSLDHVQWLGETEEEIAAEKLAVLRDHSTLFVGRVGEDILALARRLAEERGARIVEIGEESAAVGEGSPYQRRNLALAEAAARELAGELDQERVREAAARLRLRGRMELVEGRPPVLLDAAHNPEAAAALAEALQALPDGRPVVAAVAVLADKDAEGIVAALAPHLEALICTAIPDAALVGHGRPGATSHDPVVLAEIARRHGIAEVEVAPDPQAAFGRARELAAGRSGLAVITGSHYLLPYAWTGKPAPSSSR
jgi:dihydrofolate synthase / folylpolyglutamate synthase